MLINKGNNSMEPRSSRAMAATKEKFNPNINASARAREIVLALLRRTKEPTPSFVRPVAAPGGALAYGQLHPHRTSLPPSALPERVSATPRNQYILPEDAVLARETRADFWTEDPVSNGKQQRSSAPQQYYGTESGHMLAGTSRTANQHGVFQLAADGAG